MGANREVANRLRAALTDRCALEREIGAGATSQPAISAYEAGRKSPTVATLRKKRAGHGPGNPRGRVSFLKDRRHLQA
jgi:hypothetical protein